MKKYTLITGASRGIGLEMALIAAADAKNLILAARNKKELESLKEQILSQYKVDVQIIVADLSTNDSAKMLFEQVNKHFEVTELINNAGFGDFGEFVEADIRKLTMMIELNVRALTELCYFFGQEMKKRKNGKILNVASVAAFMPGAFMSVYYATKAYVLSFSEAIANELKPYGVSVTVLCPGPTRTNFEQAADLNDNSFFNRLPVATANQVARYGLNAMNKRKIVAIEGFLNKLMIFSLRFFPRCLIRAVVRKIHGK